MVNFNKYELNKFWGRLEGTILRLYFSNLCVELLLWQMHCQSFKPALHYLNSVSTQESYISGKDYSH